jgi:hypothetical protein
MLDNEYYKDENDVEDFQDFEEFYGFSEDAEENEPKELIFGDNLKQVENDNIPDLDRELE